MKNVTKIMLILLVIFSLVSCGGDENGGSATKIEPIPEMKDFMKGFGSYSKVEQAIKQFASSNLNVPSEIEGFDLKEPKIIEEEKGSDGSVTYTIRTKSGVTVRTYKITWKDAKITEITYEGIGSEY